MAASNPKLSEERPSACEHGQLAARRLGHGGACDLVFRERHSCGSSAENVRTQTAKTSSAVLNRYRRGGWHCCASWLSGRVCARLCCNVQRRGPGDGNIRPGLVEIEVDVPPGVVS